MPDKTTETTAKSLWALVDLPRYVGHPFLSVTLSCHSPFPVTRPFLEPWLLRRCARRRTRRVMIRTPETRNFGCTTHRIMLCLALSTLDREGRLTSNRSRAAPITKT